MPHANAYCKISRHPRTAAGAGRVPHNLHVGRHPARPRMGNACCSSAPEDGGALSRTRTPAGVPPSQAPPNLDIVLSASRYSLQHLLPAADLACQRLQQLRISRPAGQRPVLDYDQCDALARVLPQCTKLRQLVIVDCSIGREAMGVLAPALAQCNALESLDLSGTSLNDSSMEVLARALPGCVELQSLGLRENAFGAAGVAALAAKLPTLRALNLLMLYGLEASSEPLERAKLPRLHLSFNNQETPRLISSGGELLSRTFTPPRSGGAPQAASNAGGGQLARTFTPPVRAI